MTKKSQANLLTGKTAKFTGIAVLIIVLVVLITQVKRPGPSETASPAEFWAQIKKDQRLLSIYESVIQKKAQEYNRKVETLSYGIADYELTQGIIQGEGRGREGLAALERDLQMEMDTLSRLIQQREELKEGIARKRLHHQLNIDDQLSKAAPAS